jgi:hypothetical protein
MEVLVLPGPRTVRNPGLANPRNLFDRMPEWNSSAAYLFNETPWPWGEGANGGESPEGAPTRGEKSSSTTVVVLVHAGRHAELVR